MIFAHFIISAISNFHAFTETKKKLKAKYIVQVSGKDFFLLSTFLSHSLDKILPQGQQETCQTTSQN